ncbi:hypothetical protein ACO0K7_18915 [Undibacterium sp. Ji67W]|uniref:hypothetical protein n=1 Tax=Undibacterium sp. Ji67W TaxID=3413042 RepID=UPI003BF077B9
MDNEELLWEIYDEYRTARLNVKYYSARLNTFENWNDWLEVLVAVTASGSTISGFWFFKTDEGVSFWKFLLTVSGLAAFFKPFLKLTHKIRFFEQTLSGYRALDYELGDIVLQIKKDQGCSKLVLKMFDAAKKKKKDLVTKPPEIQQKKKLINKFYEEVLNEIPKESLYLPKDSVNGNK